MMLYRLFGSIMFWCSVHEAAYLALHIVFALDYQLTPGTVTTGNTFLKNLEFLTCGRQRQLERAHIEAEATSGIACPNP